MNSTNSQSHGLPEVSVGFQLITLNYLKKSLKLAQATCKGLNVNSGIPHSPLLPSGGGIWGISGGCTGALAVPAGHAKQQVPHMAVLQATDSQLAGQGHETLSSAKWQIPHSLALPAANS